MYQTITVTIIESIILIPIMDRKSYSWYLYDTDHWAVMQFELGAVPFEAIGTEMSWKVDSHMWVVWKKKKKLEILWMGGILSFWFCKGTYLKSMEEIRQAGGLENFVSL